MIAPYGVREGARQMGKEGEGGDKYNNFWKVPYEVENVFIDLVQFAANHLTVGGRLVFWLPTGNE